MPTSSDQRRRPTLRRCREVNLDRWSGTAVLRKARRVSCDRVAISAGRDRSPWKVWRAGPPSRMRSDCTPPRHVDCCRM